MSVRDIIAKSSNRGAAQVGLKIGEDILYKYACAYGYGQETGIKLPGEVNGILYPPKRWDGLTITRMPMGHAVAATPLQIHCAISSIANDGVLMRPQIVRKVLDNDGQTVIAFGPTARRQVISPAVAHTMAQMMIKTVSAQGTAVKAEIPGYEVAGKTGTAQKIVNGQYSRTEHVASFSGFFPARDPKLAITVIVDTPHGKGVGYGGLVAAPAFHEVATRLIQYLAIPPVDPEAAAAKTFHSSTL
jgi:cell division protein FtsI/penicillin-binding protein 2